MLCSCTNDRIVKYKWEEMRINMRTISEIKRIILIVFFLAITGNSFSQNKDSMSKQWDKMFQSKKRSLEKFNDAKFGMFIHWGAYSMPAGIWKGKKIKGLGEWVCTMPKFPGKNIKRCAVGLTR
jgi:hypothetical protein